MKHPQTHILSWSSDLHTLTWLASLPGYVCTLDPREQALQGLVGQRRNHKMDLCLFII